MLFSLNGREYASLGITGFSVKLETLDGDGSARSKAYGWPMIRDPQGTIINLNLEFKSSSSRDPEFAHLWQTCKSMGETEFALVRFVDPTGQTFEQNMYLVASELKYRLVDREDGTVYSESLKVNFIAEKGM